MVFQKKSMILLKLIELYFLSLFNSQQFSICIAEPDSSDFKLPSAENHHRSKLSQLLEQKTSQSEEHALLKNFLPQQLMGRPLTCGRGP